MNTQDCIERLEDVIDEAWNLPLSNGKCVVDAETIRELVREVRDSLPGELEQAMKIVKDRNDIITTARHEAEVIVKNAQEKARALVSRDEIVLEARKQGNELLASAKKQAADIVNLANEQASALVADTNRHVSDLMSETNEKVREMKQMANDYADDMMRKMSEVLGAALTDVRQTYQTFKNNRL
ncbi:HrpE/YscL family type III secretion apparatus protein [Feifania hominis]|uniref:ATPase n=1 Tax=Feifania hominis TaxID=2763660 RepID=A0A926DA31_9FIRM|nr:HrpE/YscL family type III secretion apparatus protein [Feifania hominis]MBC8535180.1 hypothetical protein [Feifania hominis]